MNETQKLINFVRMNKGVNSKALKDLIKASKVFPEFNKDLPKPFLIGTRLKALEFLGKVTRIKSKWFVVEDQFYD